MNESTYPIINAELGSPVMLGSLELRSPVIAVDTLGKFNPVITIHSTMSGESHYVHTDDMNLASLTLSGSYGITGVEEFKNSTYGYVGRSSAMDAMSVKLNWSKIVEFGNERINFRELTVGQFVSSLTADVQQRLLLVLKDYNHAVKLAKESGLSIPESVINKSAEYVDLHDAINKWIGSCAAFINDHGFGLVVGVKWGAFGTVSMRFDEKGDATQWKYGGGEQFTYSEIGTSITVDAAYSGSQNDASSKVSYTVESFSFGNFISQDISSWATDLNNAGFDKTFNISPFSKAPDIETKDWTKDVPPFLEPKVDDAVKEEIDQLDPDTQDEMATANGLNDANQKSPGISVEEFNNESNPDGGKRAETGGLNKIINDIKSNRVDVTEFLNKDLSSHFAVATSPTVQKDEGNLVPIGVWIAKWVDLIPWISIPIDNNAANADEYLSIKYRTVLQDLFTLSRIYLTASDSGLATLYRLSPHGKDIITRSVGTEFGHVAVSLQGLSEVSVESVGAELRKLGDSAFSIYSIWAKHPFLRNAELGLGVLVRGNLSVENVIVSEKSKEGEYAVYPLTNCDFSGSNYSVFSAVLKVLPIIHPEGVFYGFGPKEGGLLTIHSSEINFCTTDYHPKLMAFQINDGDEFLSNSEGSVKLYPITLEQAKGTDWVGISTGASVLNDHNLMNNLATIKGQLSGATPYTLSSSSWKGRNWNKDTIYDISKIPLQSVGLVPLESNPL